MKVVSINRAPSACDRDGLIRPDITDLNRILANIDASRLADATSSSSAQLVTYRVSAR